MTTSVTVSARQRWSRSKVAVVIGTLVVLAAVVLAWAQSQYGRGYLDPTSPEPAGSLAVVELLREDGIDVVSTDDAEAVLDQAQNSTVLVTAPDLLGPGRLDDLSASGADLVLIGPTVSAEDLETAVTWEPVATEVVEPECDLRAATLAGTARVGGIGYVTTDDAEAACYPVDGMQTLVVMPTESATLTLVGSGDLFTNRYLDEDGNAALAMNLLGSHPRLVWYQPEPASGGDTAAADLLPDGVFPIVGMLAVAAVVAAAWRGRRMGRLVVEPLPVVVRASETAEGRGRLYRHGRDRAHSAAVLREASVDRLRHRLGMPRASSPRDVAMAAADQLDRPAAELLAVLDGDPPADDAALVALADDLDAIEAALHARR